MEFRSLYITFPNQDEARRVAGMLVEERLVACTNMFVAVESQYWWDGEVVSDTEVVVIAKTSGDRVDAAIARVKMLHSYKMPCVVALPIIAGNSEYLDWLRSETTPQTKSLSP